MSQIHNYRFLGLIILLTLGGMGCIVIRVQEPGSHSIVDVHYTVEADGQKMPAKDIRTESRQEPDGTIRIKTDVQLHQEGQQILDDHLKQRH